MSEQDSFRLTCTGCGRPYRVSSDLAGLTAHCPRCGAATPVPAHLDYHPDTSGDEHVQALKQTLHSHAHCPRCGEALAPEACICVACGYDIGRGRPLKLKRDRSRGGARLVPGLLRWAAVAALLYAVLRLIQAV